MRSQSATKGGSSGSFATIGVEGGYSLGFVPGMTRSELVARLADLNPCLYRKDIAPALDAILDRIEQALAAGDTVELRGFGTFSIRRREARQRRNPHTGGTIAVPAKAAIYFRAGKAARVRLNGGEAVDEQASNR